MKKQLLKTQDEISAFFKEIGMEYDGGFKQFCNSDFTVETGKGLRKSTSAKKFKASEDDRIVKGYATTPHVDWVKDSVTMEAIKKAKSHLLRKGTNTVFVNHDQDRPIGKVVDAIVDKVGLFITVLVSKAKDVEDYWTKIKEGIIGSFSIRFMAKVIELVRDNDGGIKRWEIKEMEILEVSFAPLPMNRTANITSVVGKSMKDLGHSDSKQKRRSNVMKKSDSKTGAIAEIVKELVGQALDEKFKSHLEEIKGLLPKTKEDVEAEAKADADAKAKAKADADAKELETLREENKALKEDGKRKGTESGDAADKGKGDIKKALVSVEDEDTCYFVLKAMESDDVYNGLTDFEKDKCKQLYFQMLKSESKI